MDNQADKDAAIQWARNLIANNEFVILDVETTGLAGTDEIVEISIITAGGQRILSNQRVKPSSKAVMQPRAFEVHGIAMSNLEYAPRITDFAQEIADAVRGKSVVGWNVAFDKRMLLQSFAAHGIDQPDILSIVSFECAMIANAGFVGEWDSRLSKYKWQKLPGAGHNSLTDCRQVLAVIKEMAATPTSYEADRVATNPTITNAPDALVNPVGQRTLAFEHGTGEIKQGPAPETAAQLSDLLGLVGVTISADMIRTWTLANCEEVREWAAREYLFASDNTIDRLPRPGVVDLATDDGADPAANGYTFNLFEIDHAPADEIAFRQYIDSLIKLLGEAGATISIEDASYWTYVQRGAAITWAAKTFVANIDLTLNGHGTFPSWPEFFPSHDIPF